jgi:hypothetical protein
LRLHSLLPNAVGVWALILALAVISQPRAAAVARHKRSRAIAQQLHLPKSRCPKSPFNSPSNGCFGLTSRDCDPLAGCLTASPMPVAACRNFSSAVAAIISMHCKKMLTLPGNRLCNINDNNNNNNNNNNHNNHNNHNNNIAKVFRNELTPRHVSSYCLR